jgi:hypothetical protein
MPYRCGQFLRNRPRERGQAQEPTDARLCPRPQRWAHRYSIYLLYWSKRTITDAAGARHPPPSAAVFVVLNLIALLIQTQRTITDAAGARRYSIYLLYWYKRTITDAAGARHPPPSAAATTA